MSGAVAGPKAWRSRACASRAIGCWSVASGPGEVDLIMRRGEVTAFIEVKVRPTADLAVEAVTGHQSHRIAAAARIWMARDPKAALGVCRFDIVAVSPYHWPRHIANAFTVED